MRILSVVIVAALAFTADVSAFGKLADRRAERKSGSGCQGGQASSGCQGGSPQAFQAAPVAASGCPCANCPMNAPQAVPAAPKAVPGPAQPAPQATAPAIAPLLGRMLYNPRTGQWTYCALCPQSP